MVEVSIIVITMGYDIRDFSPLRGTVKQVD
jgi:hypothetical protein